MNIATGAIGSLLPKLGELLGKDEHKLPKGVMQDIYDIRDEMMSFQAALERLAEVPLDQLDPQVQYWAERVKELSYGIDDVVDSFLMDRPEVSKPAYPGDFKGRMKKVANLFKKGKTQRVSANAIKDVKVQIKEIGERFPDSGEGRNFLEVRRLPYLTLRGAPPLFPDVYSSPNMRTTIDHSLVALYKNPKDIIGIEESTKDLIKKILREDTQDDNFSRQQLKILSIFGCMGLGKTTLAKVVYYKVKEDFDCGAFVQVGRQPNVQRIFKDLLLELGGERYQNSGHYDERQPIDALRTLLHQKRYLIVIDDIWDRPTWEVIQNAFVDDGCGSLVILTTRIFEVALRAGEVYKLKPLSHEKSQELFCKRVFGGTEEIPDQLPKVTDSIITKCGCIPLAIITTASLLVGKPWKNWPIVYNLIGFGHGHKQEVENTRIISLFSYYDIPTHLRTCLLHLSIFPEGYMIRKDTLIWKWIAEGFIIHDERGVGLFELGEFYFNELINRSLIQPVEIPDSGIIIGCRVNVMVLDMICFLLKKENFVTVLDSHKRDTSDRPEVLGSHHRDTSDRPEVLDSHEQNTSDRPEVLDSHEQNTSDRPEVFDSHKRDTSEQRKVLDSHKQDTSEQRKVLDSHKQDTFDRRQVRRLAIQRVVVSKKEENEMVANRHVRSFNATECEFQMMPSLTSFQLLRVLALEDCASMGGVCHLEHIRKLVQLRYIGLLNTPICEFSEGIENLKFLQTLDLRQTKIKDLPHGIVQLSRLKCLRAGSRSITVPDRMGNLASLEELQLSDASSSPNIVKELGKLTELRDLKLWIRLSDERSKRDLVESLGNLQKMNFLHLDGGFCIQESYWKGYIPSLHLRHVFLGMKFSRLPAWIKPFLLPKLSHLSVDVSVVEEEDLLILGSFPELVSLSLIGEHICLPDITGSGAFPRLKYCYTSGMVRFLNGAAQILESISFNVRLWDTEDGSFDLEFRSLFRSLLDHPLLQGVRVEIFYTEAQVTKVDEVEAALRDVVRFHPNSPILDISKCKSFVSEQFGSHYDANGNDYSDDNEKDNDHEYYDEESQESEFEPTDHKVPTTQSKLRRRM